MNLKNFQLGMYMTNCYLFWNENNEAVLFDCADSKLDKLSEFIKDNNLTLTKVIFTHGHGDHIGGINKIKEIYPNIEFYIGEEEKEFLKDPNLSLSRSIHGEDILYNDKVNLVKEGDEIFGFEVIDTPGHTQGGKCFFDRKNNIMIVGDTLFKNSYGRYDLPTSDYYDLKKSLEKICTKYPEETVVYSGHSASTTIGEELRNLKTHQMF